MFGSRLVRAFEEVKDRFDPKGLFNPGKIVRAPRFDDRACFASRPIIASSSLRPRSSGPPFPAPPAAFRRREMCNNNGECRKLAGGAMCPPIA